MVYKNNKNIFNKNRERCRDIKTQKACEQGWEVNVGPIQPHISTYTAIKQNKKNCTYVGLYGSGLFNGIYSQLAV